MKKENREIIEDFVKDTKEWLIQMRKMDLVMCPICGMQPLTMLELAIALEEVLKENKKEK